MKTRMYTYAILVGIMLTLLGIVFLSTDGIDYSEEYVIYQEVRDFTTLDGITNYLQNKSLPYSIGNGKLTTEYSEINFTVTNNNCKIAPSKMMQSFEILDSGNYDDIKIKCYPDERVKGMTEEVKLAGIYSQVARINNQYFFNTFMNLGFIFVLIGIALMAIGILIKRATRKKRRHTNLHDVEN